MFRKPGDNTVPIKNDVSNEEWIEWAQPVWLDIRETNTLNERVARDEADEHRHAALAAENGEEAIAQARHHRPDLVTMDLTMPRMDGPACLEVLREQNKLVEAQRLEQRTRFDLEMLSEVGHCKGIEN